MRVAGATKSAAQATLATGRRELSKQSAKQASTKQAAANAPKTASSVQQTERAASTAKESVATRAKESATTTAKQGATRARQTTAKTVKQSTKSVEDTAGQYNFTPKQKDLLSELLSPKNASRRQGVLYGIHSGSSDIVEVAITQLDNVGDQPYWSWYGYAGRVEWCACLVSWCANECGYIESGRILKLSYCPTGASWFRAAVRWQPRGYAPKPGDIIFCQ